MKQGCRKGIVPSLNPEIVAGENNEIHFKIIRCSATGGNCSVHSLPLPSHSSPPLDSLLLRLYECLPGYLFNNIETNDKYIFRYLRQTQMVEQSSHTSCRPEFPRDMFAFRCCHGMATSV